MLYHLFQYLEEQMNLSGARLFSYVSFRAGVAIIFSLIIALFFGEKLIAYLHRKQFLERERELGLPGEALKKKTPSMGGFIIIGAILIPTILLADLCNVYIQVLLLSTVWMGGIGFLDDYLKLTRGKEGLKGKYKILGQVGLGALIGIVMLFHEDVVVRLPVQKVLPNYKVIKYDEISQNGNFQKVAYVKAPITNVPFLKGNELNYIDVIAFLGDNAVSLIWVFFIPLVIFVVTAVSNAANLTDGIDGLAAGVSAIIGAVLAIFAYVSSNSIFADYLNILFIPNAEEMVIYSACFLGGCIGFLWFNAYPAKIFMGDTGSLMLGGVIAAMAIMLRKELLIPILCGIFLLENLSVIIQVSYFKYTKKKSGEGKRIFLMSPLHHHYQKKGIHESKIVTRFWIVGIMLAVITLITLKIR